MLVGLKDKSQALTLQEGPKVIPMNHVSPREPTAPRPRPGHQRARHRRKGSRRWNVRWSASTGLGWAIYRPRPEDVNHLLPGASLSRPVTSRATVEEGLGAQGRKQPSPSPSSCGPWRPLTSPSGGDGGNLRHE